jgi:hypothetical protein
MFSKAAPKSKAGVERFAGQVLDLVGLPLLRDLGVAAPFAAALSVDTYGYDPDS